MANIKRANASGITKTGSEIPDVPDAPTIGAISDPGTDGYASVAFTAAATGGAVTTFTATSTPGSITGTSATSPITVTGLTLNTAYTFKVKGTNSTATGPESSASSSFTPTSHLSYESIATVTITSATTTNQTNTISFTSIPSTFKHLQLRGIYRDTWSSSGVGEFYIFPNSDTSTSYSDHWLQGNGAAASAAAYGSRSDGMFMGRGVRGGSLGSAFGGFVVDILDYADTNKYKTARGLSGADINGSGGEVLLQSALWQKTTAISSLNITANGYGFAQYSHFALYGIKG